MSALRSKLAARSAAQRHAPVAAPSRGDRAVTAGGLLLLAAYLIQDLADWQWPWLIAMQTNTTYKQLTGLALTLLIAHQWRLTLLRVQGRWAAEHRNASRHRLWGALATVLLYLHSARIGHGYLALLGSVFLANLLLGLLLRDLARSRWRPLALLSVAGHTALSAMISALVAYHVYVAFTYE